LVEILSSSKLGKSVVFLVGAARPHTPMSAIYLHSEGYIITARHINTYIRSLAVRQVSAGYPAFCSGENLWANI